MFGMRNIVKVVATHEAGHAIVALAFDRKFKALMVMGGTTNMMYGFEGHDDMETLITLYAGVEATDLMYGDRRGGEGDEILINDIFRRSPEILNGTTLSEVERTLRNASRQILIENKAGLRKLNNALYRKRFMEYVECTSALGNLRPSHVASFTRVSSIV